MNTTETIVEARWKTFLKAAAFLLPAVVLWGFASVFFAPKLQELWARGGGTTGDAQWVMSMVMFLVHHGSQILFVAGLLAVAGEFRARQWARYRRLALGSLVLLLNSAVLLGLWFMCAAALLIAPALMHAG
jgi:hypothetical protein